jgi:tRNA 5-methylaminomethyl-2-thiouridine biosynthesis bifunctional protein
VEEGYATPSLPALTDGGHHLIGATYQAKEVAADQEILDQQSLIEHARKWGPFQDLSLEKVEGVRVGYRASTPDKLPLIGPLTDPAFLENNYRSALRGARGIPLPALEASPGEWVFSGMGSRGITYSSLGAEILASLMAGTPIPLESDLLPHLHPSRFFIRNLRKPGLK